MPGGFCNMHFTFYIKNIIRRALADKWLAFARLFTLTVGMMAFLIIILSYSEVSFAGEVFIVVVCSFHSFWLPVTILVVTIVSNIMIVQRSFVSRYKGFFVRRLLGESHLSIVIGFLLESAIYTGVSLLFALATTEQAIQLISDLKVSEIQVSQVYDKPQWYLFIGMIIMVIFFTGFFPLLPIKKLRFRQLNKFFLKR